MPPASNSVLKKQSSSTNVEVLSANYIWTIKNFSFISRHTTKKLKSSVFTMGHNNEYKWRLRMYPNGCEESSDTHISLFLQLVSNTETEVLAKFDFSIIKSDGQKHILASHKTRSYVQFKSLGYHELIDRNQLLDEKNGLLKDDNLKILCEVNIGTGNITNELTIEEPEKIRPEESLSNDFEALLNNNMHADAILIVDGERFNVHKAILAARSPVFAVMFEHDMKEKKQNEVEIKDIDKNVIKQLIRFIYTGKTEKLDFLACGLLAAADKYALEDLKYICERSIYMNLTVENVISALVIADRHNLQNLKEQAIAFMKANAVRLVDSFTNLVLNCDRINIGK